jgi:hypothetical protein
MDGIPAGWQEKARHAVSNVAAQRDKVAMRRALVWIEQQRFRGFGCSECGWRFKPSGAPTGASFDEMMRNFELRRDKEFTSHVCGEHSQGQQREEQKR